MNEFTAIVEQYLHVFLRINFDKVYPERLNESKFDSDFNFGVKQCPNPYNQV